MDTMAALMGDSNGIMVDGTTFRNSMEFSVTVRADKDTYSSWEDLITGKWDQASKFLPGEMHSILTDLVGNYSVTVNIDKMD